MTGRVRAAFFAAAALALLGWAATFIAPAYLARDYDRRGLEGLKARADAIRTEFSALLAAHDRRLGRLADLPPAGDPRLFERIESLRLDEESEGLAVYGPDGRLAAWLGNALDLADHARADDLASFPAAEAPFIVRDKASVHLVSVRGAPAGGRIALFRLIAFIPQFQSAHVKADHLLEAAMRPRCAVDYWSFREDVSGFERIFSKHRDEFAGEPRRANEIQTLYFPLRGPDRRILATVTLSTASLTERVTIVRGSLLLAVHGLLICALLILAGGIASSAAFAGGRKPVAAAAVALLAAGARCLFIPASRLEPVRSLSVFSPSLAAFRSVGTLTGSPADIFLTAVASAVIVGCLFVAAMPVLARPSRPVPKLFSPWVAVAGLAVALALLRVFEALVRKLVLNANASLLGFTPDLPFILLHLSLLLFLASILALAGLALRAAAIFAPDLGLSLLLTVPVVAAGLLAGGGHPTILSAASAAALLALGAALARFSERGHRGEALAAVFLLGTAFLGQALSEASASRSRAIIQDFLSNAVTSQEQWANLLVRESIPEIEKRGPAIASFLKEPGSPDFAHGIWDRTLAARFNWYSGLEVLDAEGNALSRFSLNVPRLFGRQLSLPESREWAVARRRAASLGRERDVLVAYKDWYDGDAPLGRTLMFLSLDPDMLPFLYSANPYFELLRSGAIPSLNGVDFGLAIYGPDGRVLADPGRISTGLPPGVLERLEAPGAAFWTAFNDRGRTYDAYAFRDEDRTYSLYTRRRSLRARAVELLKLLALDALILAALLLPVGSATGRVRLRNAFRSFSNRVYAAFFAVALVPLLLFTVFTRGLFDRIFTARFVEEAALHAGFARSIMEDFIDLQDVGRPGLPSPPEDLVLWVAATLSNDINLYRDAKLLSSSRREFFDAGLLPDLVDGRIFRRLVVERAPYMTQRKRIGGYSFQTLTVPYELRDSTFLISMPFPFEKEEAARATGELVEFLFFLSLFFAGLVLVFARGIRTMIIVPVRKLLAGTREVGLGNLDVAIEHPSRDEMRTLVEGFNAMVGSLRAHRQELAEMGKKVAWAEMARKVAHEIKNPLTPIQLSAEHVLRVHEDGGEDFGRTLRESMSYIIGEVEHLRRVAQEFMEIARDTSVRRDACDLRALLRSILDPYRKSLSGRVRIRESYEGGGGACLGDEAKLRTAFRNIVANAVDAVRDQGEVSVSVCRSGSSWKVSVRDTGPGMTRAVLDRIFEPYFSTKDGGTGLGLPITRKIVEDHGGAVRVESEPGRGTEVVVELPVNP